MAGRALRATTSRRSSPFGALPHEGMPPGSSTCDGRSGSRSCSGSSLRQARLPEDQAARSRGAVAFNAIDTDERWLEPTPPGRVRRDCMDSGKPPERGLRHRRSRDLQLDFPKLEHHAAVYEAISFEVLDPGEGDSARGGSPGSGAGVIDSGPLSARSGRVASTVELLL